MGFAESDGKFWKKIKITKANSTKLLNLPSVLSRKEHKYEGKYYKCRSWYWNHSSRSCDEGRRQTVSPESCVPCWCTAGPNKWHKDYSLPSRLLEMDTSIAVLLRGMILYIFMTFLCSSAVLQRSWVTRQRDFLMDFM